MTTGIGPKAAALAARMVADGTIVPTASLRKAGIHPETLARMVRAGGLRHLTTMGGVSVGYMSSDFPEPERTHERLWEVAARHPRAVACLHSAARYHDLSDRPSGDVAAVTPTSNRVAKLPGLKLVAWSRPEMFTVGVETIEVAPGLTVRITDPARTVADFFREQHRMTDADKEHAFGQLVARQGEGAMDRAFAYASALGWRHDMEGAVLGTRGTLKWLATPKP